MCTCVCTCGEGGFIKLCCTLRRSHSLFLGSFPLPCTEGIGNTKKSPGTRIVTSLVDGIEHDSLRVGVGCGGETYMIDTYTT